MSFSAGTKKWAVKSLEGVEKLRKEVAIELFSSVATDTPKLTGRATGNWVPSNDEPIHDVDENRFDPTSAKTIESVRSVVGSVGSVGKSNDSFLTNGLYYIEKLEGGSSTKAPDGMVGKNVVRITEKLKANLNG